MNATQPIRNARDLEKLKGYYQSVNPNKRNYLLIIIGLNTALRVSDVLNLCWGDVYDFDRHQIKEHIAVTEQKTDKSSMIFINRSVKKALEEYRMELKGRNERIAEQSYLFRNSNGKNNPISRVQAFRIVKKAAQECHIDGVISCHSLRKTFGYHAWKQGVSPALLMTIYNHSSFQVTKHYLGIEQDDRDRIFRSINL